MWVPFLSIFTFSEKNRPISSVNLSIRSLKATASLLDQFKLLGRTFRAQPGGRCSGSMRSVKGMYLWEYLYMEQGLCSPFFVYRYSHKWNTLDGPYRPGTSSPPPFKQFKSWSKSEAVPGLVYEFSWRNLSDTRSSMTRATPNLYSWGSVMNPLLHGRNTVNRSILDDGSSVLIPADRCMKNLFASTKQ